MIKFLATGFYSGYSPIAPGTAGSLVAILLGFLFPQKSYLQIVVIGSLLIVGIGICQRAEKAFGRKDPPQIVWDEMVGMWIALIFLPRSLEFVIAAFVLFRFLDIWKPFKAIERLPGGYGIMLDDVLAGGLTNLALHLLRAVL